MEVENEPRKWENKQQLDYTQTERLLTRKPCQAQFANDKENKTTTDASETVLGIT